MECTVLFYSNMESYRRLYMNNLAYHDAFGYEKINAQAVVMPPSPMINHSAIVGNIYAILKAYLTHDLIL